jgi:hypothetical protein
MEKDDKFIVPQSEEKDLASVPNEAERLLNWISENRYEPYNRNGYWMKDEPGADSVEVFSSAELIEIFRAITVQNSIK